MVFIPFDNYGICKHWMLKRCYLGGSCQWKHPAPAERKRIWDECTKEQNEAAARGVPRPVNPRLAKRPETSSSHDNPSVRYEGRSEGSSSGLRDRYLPPPPRPPPPPSPPPRWAPEPTRRNDAPLGIDATQFPTTFAGRGSDMASYNHPPQVSAAREVSMLDAPDSPMERSLRPAKTQSSPSALDGNIDFARLFYPEAPASGWVGVAADANTARKRDEAGTSAPAQDDHDVAINEADHATDTQPVLNEYWSKYRSRRDGISVKKDCDVAEGAVPRGAESSKPKASGSFPNFTTSSPQTLSKPSTTNTMGATKRMSNGEVKHVGPHPSTIRVSARYASHALIEKTLQPQPATANQAASDVQERLTAEAREDSIRLQGCRWLDDVRRQMQLPIRTFTTACTYYHKFRLAHPQHVAGMEYGNAWADACAASLLTACKVEDTLKKSKDILAAAHNLRASTTGGEQVGTDDAMFEAPSRVVIGLERLVLEAGSFDFRSKYPHELMVKIAKTLDGDEEEKRAITGLAWSVLTDLHRTFAPLKQTSASMAVASLELASHLYAAGTSNDSSAIRDSFADFNFEKHSTSREEVMETILDALDLYTHHTLQTLLGSKYGLDDYLRIRLAFNKECSENSLPRHTVATPRENEQEPNGNTLRIQNGHPTPVSPSQPETQTQASQQPTTHPTPEGGGTVRFLLNPQLAADEKSEVQKYFVEEWEEYEEEIEVPIPRAPSPDRGSDRSDRRPPLTGPPRAPPPGPPRGDYRGPPPRYDDRRGGSGRYEDRRYDDRRYDDRRGGGRYEDRRYDDRRRERR